MRAAFTPVSGMKAGGGCWSLVAGSGVGRFLAEIEVNGPIHRRHPEEVLLE